MVVGAGNGYWRKRHIPVSITGGGSGQSYYMAHHKLGRLRNTFSNSRRQEKFLALGDDPEANIRARLPVRGNK